MINPDVCSCCGEIWNRNNLKRIPLGKHRLKLCPACYSEYAKLFKNTVNRDDVLDACDKFAIGGTLDGYYLKCLKQWMLDLPPAMPADIKKEAGA